jgi:putative transposase
LAVRDLAILLLHLLATLARLAGPGARSVVAESVLVKQQLLILNRSRKRSPRLRLSDRMVAGLCALLMRPGRLIRAAIVLKPSTLLGVHRALTKQTYRRLFSSKVRKKPGPKGPTQDVIAAVVEMKRRNPTWGSPRIAQQIALAFWCFHQQGCRAAHSGRAVSTGTRVGWTILAHIARPHEGPSVESRLVSVRIGRPSNPLAARRDGPLHASHRGFGVQRGVVDGMARCRMFNHATRGQTPPTYLSADHDPLYRFHQWQANLRILDVTELKTVPYVPLSHPFVERLIGTIRRECLDRTLFWTSADLETKLLDFQRFYRWRARDGQFVSMAAALSGALSDADGGVSVSDGLRLGNV